MSAGWIAARHYRVRVGGYVGEGNFCQLRLDDACVEIWRVDIMQLKIEHTGANTERTGTAGNGMRHCSGDAQTLGIVR